MSVTVNAELCIGCGCCSDVCMSGALELQKKAIVIEEHCIECGLCIEMCPAQAMSLYALKEKK